MAKDSSGKKPPSKRSGPPPQTLNQEQRDKYGRFLRGNQISVGQSPGRPKMFDKEFVDNEAVELLKWFEIPNNFWLKKFALERGYSPQRFEDFKEISSDFAEALKICKDLQESKLLEMGLFNVTNAGLTKFTLQNNHGWSERQTIVGDASNPLNFLVQKGDGDSKDLVNDSEGE